MQNKYSVRFKEASLTGSKCLWLKATEKCDCFDEEDLLNSEPNPNCPKCLGTGMQRQAIKTEKIRNEIYNAYHQQFEQTNKNTTINEQRKFYFSEFYKDISTTDYIIFLDKDEKTFISIYKITNKEQFRVDDFIYYEVIGKKINFIGPIEYSDFDELLYLNLDPFNVGDS